MASGRDLVGQAATGTGKTAAFALPVLQRILRDGERGEPRALVLVPTPELAVQVSEAVRRYGDRAYRYVHLDAGYLGERLNLAAVRQGLGASGIGGFFDDEVNGVLGLPEREAVVYLTTLGVPMRPRKG